MDKRSACKALGFVAGILGAASAVIGFLVDDKNQEALIEEKVAEAMNKQNQE